MQILLDTHAFIWWLCGDQRLSAAARIAIANESNVVFVSAASAWEIGTKHRIGKLHGVAALAADISGAIASQGFTPLPIEVSHAQAASALPGPHRDPFDRMLVAQALLQKLALISNERIFDSFGVRRIW